MPLSELILHDVATGAEAVAFASDDLIEAPNWSPCGTYLLVNGGGRLYRLDVGSYRLIHIETPGLSHLNNDHGISPDGTVFAISNNPGRGLSEIFTLPASGGAPRPLGLEIPAYWHSWSPDGASFAYTARRAGLFQICTCPATGGHETQLTHGPGHRDGPDFTPDGDWIWFNSDHHRTTPDLWRIRPDGSALEQMTDEPSVNWFPHPSPDGTHVLYMAYGAHVEGHPRGEDVTLRLMPQTGGASREVAAFHGGQGSINVPNWAPDGRRFAYMRYARD